MRTRPCFVILAVAVLLMSLANGGPASAEGKTEAHTRYPTGTLMLLSALSDKQYSSIAAGYVLLLDSVSAATRAQILEAAKHVYVDPCKEGAPALPDGSRIGVLITPRFSVTVLGGALESDRPGALSLSEAVPALGQSLSLHAGASPGSWEPSDSVVLPFDLWSATVDPDPARHIEKLIQPRLAAPPSYRDIIAKAPADPDAKLAWLKQRAFEVLEPAGKNRLAQAAGVPFEYADFSQGRHWKINSLSPERLQWLERVYSAHRASRMPSKDVRIEPTPPPLPEWKELVDSGDASLKLGLMYVMSVATLQPVTDDLAKLYLRKVRAEELPERIPHVYATRSSSGMSGWGLTSD